jgi:5-methylcytosine-specific restriction enzyme A
VALREDTGSQTARRKRGSEARVADGLTAGAGGRRWPLEATKLAGPTTDDATFTRGGQQQGGICTPKDYPVVIAFTGTSGHEHGYQDSWTADGVYRYFGEGQEGDMTWKGGNVAIRYHGSSGEDLLLFQTLGGGNVRFLGEFVCAGDDFEQAQDSKGAMRRAIVFNLVPATEVGDNEITAPAQVEANQISDLQVLRARAFAAVSTPANAGRATAKRNVYERSRDIRAYVLARTGGQCEACTYPAPFITREGAPYLEPHHIRRLGDGGPDDPRFMGAVCPICHRNIHHGAEGRVVNERLQVAVAKREAELDS